MKTFDDTLNIYLKDEEAIKIDKHVLETGEKLVPYVTQELEIPN